MTFLLKLPAVKGLTGLIFTLTPLSIIFKAQPRLSRYFTLTRVIVPGYLQTQAESHQFTQKLMLQSFLYSASEQKRPV